MIASLRIAHFLGIHSLQLLPLLGYYIAKSKKQIIGLSVIYFIIVMAVFIQALSGRPLLF
jgi:Ni,Fe-hydrogenase I cytochrome b subunit